MKGDSRIRLRNAKTSSINRPSKLAIINASGRHARVLVRDDRDVVYGAPGFAARLGELRYLVAAHVVDKDLADTHLVMGMHRRNGL